MVNTADKTTAFYLMVHWLPGYNRPATLFLGHWTLYISIFTTFNLLDYAKILYTANYSLNLFRCIIKHLNLISLWISNATLFSVYGHCSRTTQPHYGFLEEIDRGLRTLVLVFHYMYYSENIGNFELSYLFVLMAG